MYFLRPYFFNDAARTRAARGDEVLWMVVDVAAQRRNGFFADWGTG
jgi:hypothetical protein